MCIERRIHAHKHTHTHTAEANDAKQQAQIKIKQNSNLFQWFVLLNTAFNRKIGAINTQP